MRDTAKGPCVTGLFLVLSVAASWLLSAYPAEGTFVTSAGVVAQGWLSAGVRSLFPVAWAVSAAAAWLMWRTSGRMLADARPGPGSLRSVLQAVRPLLWLPPVLLGRHSSAFLGHDTAALFLPFGGTLVAAICLERMVGGLVEAGDAPPVSRGASPSRGHRRFPSPPSWALVFAGYCVLVFLACRYHVNAPFSGGGDVGHYRMMLENLAETGSFDLTDRMDRLMDADGVPDSPADREAYVARSHARINRDGRVFSCHSFGFPLAAAPFRVLLGERGVSLFLVLVAAAGVVGCRAACRASGASRAAAGAVTALLALSYVWIFTGLSRLPEMLGCALCAWAFWAVMAQDEPGRRWAATAVCAVACGYLPYAHVRFAPLALTLAGLFGLAGLFAGDEPFWRRRVPRLAVFAALTLSAWGLLAHVHSRIYAGTAAYDYGGTFFSCPAAMWGMFADRRGLVVLLPSLWVMAVAPLRCLCDGGGKARRAAASGLLVMAAVLLSCCSNRCALGGACMSGRYMIQCVPALLPALALVLGRTDRAGRVWIFFLSLLPVLYFVFVTPFVTWKSGLLRAPSLGFFLPFLNTGSPLADVLGDVAPRVRAMSAAFVMATMAFSLLSCFRMRVSARLASAALLLLPAFFCWRAVARSRYEGMDGRAAVSCMFQDRRWTDFRVLRGNADYPYFKTMGLLKPGAYGDADAEIARLKDGVLSCRGEIDKRCMEMTAIAKRDKDLFPGAGGLCYPLSRGRPFRPCKKGTTAVLAQGEVIDGAARIYLVVGRRVATPGGVALRRGPFYVVFMVRTDPSTEGMRVFISQDGDKGDVTVARNVFAPYMRGIGKIAAPPPEYARIIMLPGGEDAERAEPGHGDVPGKSGR